jgi:O-antigen/teichoic acid export membrane protein
MLGFGVLAFVFLSSRMSNDVVLYAAVVMFLISILPTCCGILRGFGKNITGQVADLLARPLITMCILYILYRLDFLSVKTALVAQALAAASSICFCLYSIINEAGGNTKPGIWSPPAGWFSTSSAFFASALLLALNSNYPMIIASFFVPAAELGVFKVALASAAIIGLPAAAANISMSPVISSLWAQGDTLALRRAMAQTTALTFFTTLLGVALFILIGRDLLKLLFGAQYAGAYIPLLILSVAQLIVSAFGTTGSFLNMTGRERLAIRAFAVAVPVGLISAFPLTVVFGVSGAAAGNIVMVSLWHWIVLYQHRQDVEVPVSIHSAIRFLRDRS